MGAHSYLPPSGADAWVHCPKWPAMNAAYPQDDTADTLVGNAAHWALAQLFQGSPVTVGEVAENGEILTEEMVQSAHETFEWASAQFPESAFDSNLTEVRLPIRSIHEVCFGTTDRVQISPSHIVILDFKHGHRFVSEFENWQLLAYLRGVLDWLISQGRGDEIPNMRISLAIAQPRAYDRRGHFRVWEIEAGTDLSRYWIQLWNAAIAAFADDPVAVAGPHCLDCPGRAKCDALRDSGHRVVSVARASPPHDLTALEAAAEYDLLAEAAAILKARMRGLEDEMVAAHERGERGFGFSLERSFGNKVWSLPPEQVAVLGQMYGIELSRIAVKTPTQAISAGLPADIVDQYASRPLGEPKLIKSELTLAHRAFSKKA